MAVEFFEMETAHGWKLRSSALSPDVALDLLPYVMVAAAPLMGAQVDLANLVMKERAADAEAATEGEEGKPKVDPVALAHDVVAGMGRVFAGIGQALLRPDAKGGFRVLAAAFRDVTSVWTKEGQFKRLDETTYAGVFTGHVPDLMAWIQGNVALNYSAFLSIAPNERKPTKASPTTAQDE